MSDCQLTIIICTDIHYTTQKDAKFGDFTLGRNLADIVLANVCVMLYTDNKLMKNRAVFKA